jgi:hypothetical protein
MGSLRALVARIAVAAFIGAVGPVGAVSAQDDGGRSTVVDPLRKPPQPTPAGIWTKLSFRGKNWLARFSAELEMEAPSTRSGGSDAMGVEGAVWVASLRTDLDSFLLDDRSTRLRAYFDPLTGAVFRLTQLSLGSSPDYKSYLFEETGARRTRTEPDEGQALDTPEQWPDRPPEHHVYDAERLGCRVVSSPGALAWWLTWGPGARLPTFPDVGACHFLGKTLYRVEIEQGKTRETRVDYRLLREGGATRRQGSVLVRHYGIVSRPIAGKMDEKTVIAEMEIDVETRLPWRFVMREGPFQIDALLERAVLDSLPRPEEAGSSAGAGSEGARAGTGEAEADRVGSQPPER